MPESAAADERQHAASIERDIQHFLESRTRTAWDPDTDLFASGAVSSLFAMELVVFVEQTFGITVAGVDLARDNFCTVRQMTSLVLRLGGGTGGA
ncbi:acyl carrier protein [Kitasatospora sp. NPDC059327]|uniref:acyl carrier protein n=1 Tax=Kitasatospora sp. NPDC059327 TaxID=3346803 RepID=UPI0036CD0D91